MGGWPAGAAVAALVLLAVGAGWLVRRRSRAAPLGEAAAMTAAEGTIPGFSARTALVGADRGAALVVGERGRVALVTARGAREVRWADIRAGEGGLRVEAGARTVLVAGVDALDVRRAGDDGWRARP